MSTQAITPTATSARSISAWVGTAARIILGVVLLIAGQLKVGNLNAAGQSARAYMILPFEVGTIVGQLLPFIEIATGILLILGLLTRAASIIGSLLMLAFIIAIASVWIRHISIDCGCFGQGGPVKEFKPWTYFWEIMRDTGLLACGIWLIAKPLTKFSLDNKLFPPITTD